MARDVPKDFRAGGGVATALRGGLEDPAESARMTRLVRAAQSGDRAALDALIDALAPVVLSVVRCLLGPRPDIGEVVHDVLVVVVKALPSWPAESPLVHFAVRIAAGRAMATPRRARRLIEWFERLTERHRIPLPGSVFRRERLALARRRQVLRIVLGELPEVQAEAMLLRLSLGYSVEQIAVVSNTPTSVVRNRLRLAKEALRHRVEADPHWTELWGNPG
jgi:RNA polymerase sigma factor (sigma-70 family)